MKDKDRYIKVWTTPISPALEEAYRFQRIMMWVLGIGFIILLQIIIFKIF